MSSKIFRPALLGGLTPQRLCDLAVSIGVSACRPRDRPERRRTLLTADFGKQVPMKRPGQPAELATAFVMLADPLSSYVSGATIAVTGGKPIL